MDEQRLERSGKANYFLVIPIRSEEIIAEIKAVKDALEQRYKTCRSELRKGFSESELHITLLAFHASQQKALRVEECLRRWERIIQEENLELGFDLMIKGLGAWYTKKENIILYADLSQDSAQYVKNLAKEIHDFLESELKSLDLEDESKDEGMDNFWMDNPIPDVYVPHVTLMNLDQKWDHKLRQLILDLDGTTGRKYGESNGWDYHLLRDIRRQFAKTSFGTTRVQFLEFQQNGYRTLSQVQLMKE